MHYDTYTARDRLHPRRRRKSDPNRTALILLAIVTVAFYAMTI